MLNIDLIAEGVVRAAEKYGVPIRDLRPRSILSLHHPAFWYGSSLSEMNDEIERQALHLKGVISEFRSEYRRIGVVGRPSDLVLRSLTEREYSFIFGEMHYLRHAPSGALSIAGVDPQSGMPVVALSYEKARWRNMRKLLRRSYGKPEVAVVDVSRVYALEGAPKGAISWLIGHLVKVLRAEGRGEALLSTAVDTTLGFSGISYEASGWRRSIVVDPRPYAYLDGEFVPSSYLLREFGTADFGRLSNMLGVRFTYSDPSLRRPTLIYSRSLRKADVVPGEVKYLSRGGGMGQNMSGENCDHR